MDHGGHIIITASGYLPVTTLKMNSTGTYIDQNKGILHRSTSIFKSIKFCYNLFVVVIREGHKCFNFSDHAL